MLTFEMVMSKVKRFIAFTMTIFGFLINHGARMSFFNEFHKAFET